MLLLHYIAKDSSFAFKELEHGQLVLEFLPFKIFFFLPLFGLMSTVNKQILTVLAVKLILAHALEGKTIRSTVSSLVVYVGYIKIPMSPRLLQLLILDKIQGKITMI
mmetsp:Transcript_25503/g.33323  ORF Transcript_25503/g.33323 Transcript_25503/m.33323 type:complete len:107 (-) Transcript_25503:1173-1493(-)